MKKPKASSENHSLEAEKTKSEIRKTKVELWLGVANLILTAVIGIGLALFFRARDEQFQTNIVKLQADVERQSKLARIQLNRTCLYRTYCGGSITIINNGPANANNVKIVFVITDRNAGWEKVINSIDVFSLKQFPSSLVTTKTFIKADVLYDFQQIDGNNAISVSIDTLPPNQEVKFLIEYDDTKIKTVKHTETREINVTYAKELDSIGIESFIARFIEESYVNATFEVSVSCDNCDGNIEPVSIFDSAAAGYTVSNIQTQDGGNEIVYEALLESEYYLPEGIQRDPTTFPLNLVARPSDNEQGFELVSK